MAGWLAGLLWEVIHSVHGQILSARSGAGSSQGCCHPRVGDSVCWPDRSPGTPRRDGDQDGCFLRESCKRCPRPLASLPQVCGGKGGIDGLSAEGKENRKKKP